MPIQRFEAIPYLFIGKSQKYRSSQTMPAESFEVQLCDIKIHSVQRQEAERFVFN